MSIRHASECNRHLNYSTINNYHQCSWRDSPTLNTNTYSPPVSERYQAPTQRRRKGGKLTASPTKHFDEHTADTDSCSAGFTWKLLILSPDARFRADLGWSNISLAAQSYRLRHDVAASCYDVTAITALFPGYQT